MTLLHAPDVTLQFWLRVGNEAAAAAAAGVTTPEKKEEMVEEERIFVMDCGMLNRFIEEIEKITAIACKLERLHLK